MSHNQTFGTVEVPTSPIPDGCLKCQLSPSNVDTCIQMSKHVFKCRRVYSNDNACLQKSTAVEVGPVPLLHLECIYLISQNVFIN